MYVEVKDMDEVVSSFEIDFTNNVSLVAKLKFHPRVLS